jgi:hypothetical protein
MPSNEARCYYFTLSKTYRKADKPLTDNAVCVQAMLIVGKSEVGEQIGSRQTRSFGITA